MPYLERWRSFLLAVSKPPQSRGSDGVSNSPRKIAQSLSNVEEPVKDTTEAFLEIQKVSLVPERNGQKRVRLRPSDVRHLLSHLHAEQRAGSYHIN